MRDSVSTGEESRHAVAQPGDGDRDVAVRYNIQDRRVGDMASSGPVGQERAGQHADTRSLADTRSPAEPRSPAHQRNESGASSAADPSGEVHMAKRPVSKRACLACREKKIKCDGEISYSVAGGAESDGGKAPKRFTYKKCTNCMMAGIECVYVPSRRGGRRKKHHSHSASLEDAHAVHAKRRAGDIRMSDPRFYMRGPGGMPHAPAPPPPPGWGFMGGYTPPPPPPPPGPPGGARGMFYGYPPRPFPAHHACDSRGLISRGDNVDIIDAAPGADTLRSGTFSRSRRTSSASDDLPGSDSYGKRESFVSATSVAEAHVASATSLAHSRSARALKNTDTELPLFVTEDGLHKVGLPSFGTILDIVDLHYRYVECNFKILPSRQPFVEQMEISAPFVSLLAAIFQSSINYCKEGAVEEAKFLDLHYWSTLYERHRDVASLQMRLSICILGCFRGRDDLLNESSQMIKVMKCLDWGDIRRGGCGTAHAGDSKPALGALAALASPSVFCPTTHQALAAECFIRTLWAVYRFEIFRRVRDGNTAQGAQGAQGEQDARDAPDFYNSTLTLPSSDADYYSAIDNPMGLVAYLSSIERKTLKEAVNGDFTLFTDKQALDLAAPARDPALERNILRLRRCAALAPYRVSRGGVLTLDADNTLSCAVLDLALALYHYRRSRALALWPLARLPRGKAPGAPIFERTYSKSEVIDHVAAGKCTSEHWENLLHAAQWALDVRQLLMLGKGILPDGTKKSAIVNSDAQYPAAVTDVAKENEVWAQLPDFIQTVALDAAVILSCFAMYTVAFKISTLNNQIVIEGADSGAAVIASIPIENTGMRSRASLAPLVGATMEAGSAQERPQAQTRKVLRTIEQINEYIRASAQYFEELRKVADEISRFVAQLEQSSDA
ncbi:hypothetical protein HII13_001534 [Brettanomyces bruxellensis]|nr:hypothetical protein HII13_001534 [Brettanomyces bruxellensis]